MRWFLALVGTACLSLVSPARAADTITIFAAASLKNALDPAGQAFAAKTGTEVRISYASSATLAKQIEQGAPADLFASADTDWMDYLQVRNLVQKASRTDLLGNALVVIVPRASTLLKLDLTPQAFAAAMGGGRLATGDVASVPVGLYAKAALMQLGLWQYVSPHLALTDNVRSALQFVARAEVPLGIVYATDAAAEAAVRVVATFPDSSHPAIIYPFALTATAKSPAAGGFLTFLQSAGARAFFERQGFVLLHRPD